MADFSVLAKADAAVLVGVVSLFCSLILAVWALIRSRRWR